MPKRVYVNVEGHRLLDKTNPEDDYQIIEDVTKVGLPTITHPTTAIEKVAGMAADVEIPNNCHVDAMEFTVYHNNGLNCELLEAPEHWFEFRVVRQYYDAVDGTVNPIANKFRLRCLFKEASKGDIETGSPYGTTCKYSVMRFEEEKDGEIVNLIDAVTGQMEKNGVSYSDVIESFLS